MAVTVQSPPKLILPKKRSEVDNRWTSQTFGMIGPAGIGKSEFWSFCEGLYIQTEPGLNHLSVMKTPCNSWEDFREIYKQLIAMNNGEAFPYDTIIIDTIDHMANHANEEIVKRSRVRFPKLANDINTIGDVPNGAGWNQASSLLMNGLDKLAQLPCAVVFIGHLDIKEIKTPTDSYHKQTIGLSKNFVGDLAAWPDHFLNIEGRFSSTGEAIRIVRTKPTMTVEAKSRGGVVPDGWKWGANSKENWEKLRGLFK